MWELPSVVCKVNKYSRLIKRPCLISGLVSAFGAPVRKTAPISGLETAFGAPVRKTALISGLETVFGALVRKTAPISGLETVFGAPVRKTAPISGLVPAVWDGLGVFRKYFLENVDVYSQHPSYLLVRGIVFKVQMLCRGELLVRT